MPSTIEELGSESASSLITDVVERNYPATLELKEGSGWLRHKSRFLGVEQGRHPQLWLEAPVDANGSLIRIPDGQRFVVSFTQMDNRFRFAVGLLRSGLFKLAGGIVVQGLMVSWPGTVQKIQRRSFFRYEIPHTHRIDVSVWDGGHAFREQMLAGARPLYPGRLVNVSVGGVCVQLYGKADPRLSPNDTVGVEFTLEDNAPQIATDAIVRRYRKLPDDAVELGLQFAGLELSADGRKTLSYLSQTITDLQRRGIRRRRVGLE